MVSSVHCSAFMFRKSSKIMKPCRSLFACFCPQPQRKAWNVPLRRLLGPLRRNLGSLVIFHGPLSPTVMASRTARARGISKDGFTHSLFVTRDFWFAVFLCHDGRQWWASVIIAYGLRSSGLWLLITDITDNLFQHVLQALTYFFVGLKYPV